MESMRCIKRRLSDIAFRTMLDDAVAHATGQPRTGPGGQRGTNSDSSVAGSHPHTGTSDKSHPGPTQDLLERYQEHVGRSINHEHAFVVWLRESRINTSLRIPYVPLPPPSVTVSDEQRWMAVDRLLHDDSLRHYTRIGGLFTLLFAQPLSRIVAMRTSQVTIAAVGTVHVTFNDLPIQMPAVLDDLIRKHLNHRGKSLYASRDTGWLFPGGSPGQHLATEAIRAQLVAIGIKPYEGRKATLFQLAADMPARCWQN